MANRRPVVLLNTGERFPSIASAMDEYFLTFNHVGRCCRNKGNFGGTFGNDILVWRYEGDYNEMTEEEIDELLGERDTDIILVNECKEFKLIQEASEYSGIVGSRIRACLRGMISYNRVSKGKRLIWMYRKDYEKLSKEEIQELIDRIYKMGTCKGE